MMETELEVEVERVARAIDSAWWQWADVHYSEEIPGDRLAKQRSLDRAKAAIAALSSRASTKSTMTETEFSPPFSYVPIPLDAYGQGPADEVDAVSTTHEVWDANCFTVATCGSEETARKIAELLNRSTSSAERSAVGEAAGIIRGFLDCPEIADCAPEDLDNETRNLERRARQYLSALVLETGVAEPVAWRWTGSLGEERLRNPEEWSIDARRPTHLPDNWSIQPLFASPPSLPAPDERLERLVKALEKIAAETTIEEPFKSEERIMPRDAMIREARAALAAVKESE